MDNDLELFPAGPPPLVPLISGTRQIDVARFSPIAQAFFDFAFSGFMERPQPSEPNRFIWRRLRRYAGDLVSYHTTAHTDLPRSRYQSLSTDEGNDGGTLRAELMAYTDFVQTGFFILYDGLQKAETVKIGLPAPVQQIIAVLPLGSRVRENFLSYCQVKATEVIQQLGNVEQKSIGVCMNTYVQHFHAERTFDLRSPIARNWLYQTLSSGLPTVTGSIEPPPGDTFLATLPTLMGLGRGGPLLTQVVGFLLRKSQVDALVYPSARMNAGVTIQNGVITGWRGWNVVDYRDAPNPPTLAESGFAHVQVAFPEPHDEVVTSYAMMLKENAERKGLKVMLSLDSLWSPEGVESLRIVHGETGEFTDTFYVQGREEQLYEHYYAFARTEAESN